MDVITFEKIPTMIVEVVKIALPLWAKVLLGALAVVALAAVVFSILKWMENEDITNKLQESTTKADKLTSENQRLTSENEERDALLKWYQGRASA